MEKITHTHTLSIFFQTLPPFITFDGDDHMMHEGTAECSDWTPSDSMKDIFRIMEEFWSRSKWDLDLDLLVWTSLFQV